MVDTALRGHEREYGAKNAKIEDQAIRKVMVLEMEP